VSDLSSSQKNDYRASNNAKCRQRLDGLDSLFFGTSASSHCYKLPVVFVLGYKHVNILIM